MSIHFRGPAAGIAACLALALPCAAQATTILSGVIAEGNWGGDYLGLREGGVYTFKSDAKIVDFYDFSATLMERFDAHTDDDQQWWGSNRFEATSWAYYDVAPPLFEATRTGFSWTITLPEATDQHFDGCYFGDMYGCGWHERRDYAVDLWMIMIFEDGSEGKAWSIDYSPLPAAVPEPATWAMMIAGFGLVGATLRSPRRRPFRQGLASLPSRR